MSLLIFTLGAGVSLYEGVNHVLHPVSASNPIVNYTVLAFAFLFEGGSWAVALKRFRAVKGTRGYFEAVRTSCHRSAPSHARSLGSSARTVSSRCISARARSWP